MEQPLEPFEIIDVINKSFSYYYEKEKGRKDKV